MHKNLGGDLVLEFFIITSRYAAALASAPSVEKGRNYVNFFSYIVIENKSPSILHSVHERDRSKKLAAPLNNQSNIRMLEKSLNNLMLARISFTNICGSEGQRVQKK